MSGLLLLVFFLLIVLWVFLALLLVSKIGLFFFFLADYFGREESDFRIEPLWDDPLRRLGLTALGDIYNLMLTMLLLFEGYVVLHRLQQIVLEEKVVGFDTVRANADSLKQSVCRIEFPPGKRKILYPVFESIK